MRATYRALAALLLTASAGTAIAEPARVGSIVVEQAWARATTPAARTGATYLTVRNTGAEADRIVSLTAPVTGHAMAHQSKEEGGVARMSEAGPLSIPAGGGLEMKPGGTHVMLMDLKGGLKAGQTFPLTLTFEKAGTVEVPVKVGDPGAMGPE